MQERSVSSVDSSFLSNRSDEVLLITPLTWITPTTAAAEEGGRAEEVEDVSGLEGEGRGEGKVSGQLIIRLKTLRSLVVLF